MKKYVYVVFSAITFAIMGIFLFNFVNTTAYNKAVSGNNERDCLTIYSGGLKELCLESIARSKEDAKICTLIPAQDKITGCVTAIAVKKGAQECSVLSEMQKTECEDRALKATNDEKLLKEGRETLSVTKCQQIQSETLKDSCLQYIGIEARDPSI